MQQVIWYSSPLGRMLLAAKEDALTGLWFEGQAHFGAALGAEREEEETPVLTAARRWLDAYFAGERPGDSVPLRPAGTVFQQAVWALLRRIPYGETMTYGAIAKKIAAARGLSRFSAQAVGGAVGRNPIAVFIPCHRVVGADGSLTGYAGGLARKEALLRLEGADVAACSARRVGR